MYQLRQLFAAWAGEPCLRCTAIGAGGSARRYYHMEGVSHRCIGAVGDDLRENEAFFAFSRHLHDKAVAVPELYAVADDRRRYLQQDFGDLTLYSLLRLKKQQGGGFDAEMLALYKQVLSDLDALQRAGRDADFSLAYPRADFDRRSMLWDLDYFKYNFLKLAHIDFDEERLEDDFENLVGFLLQADCGYFMYRDFQGRNIMVLERSPQPRLGYIDYQGGRRGAAQYDVASLLYSAKSDLPEAIRRELLQHYVRVHGDPQFMTHFWGYVLLRILQTLGAYGYRGIFERKPYFLESIPLAVGNLRRLLQEHPLPLALPELERTIENIVQRQDGAAPPSQQQAASDRLTVTVQSFSYKQGIPDNASGNGGGHIFDCRALPNPGRYAEYQCYTGADGPVVEFLRKEPAVDLFLQHAQAIVRQSVDKYLERRFTHLSVGFGCTGGQHRSVYCACRMAEWISANYPQVQVVLLHREQSHLSPTQGGLRATAEGKI